MLFYAAYVLALSGLQMVIFGSMGACLLMSEESRNAGRRTTFWGGMCIMVAVSCVLLQLLLN
jgi:membrane associated rhomboid family serine protease